jgi:hypothetical protein
MQYTRPPWADAIEKRLMDSLDSDSFESAEQPAFLTDHVKRTWIEHAYSVGDPTYAIFNNDEDLYDNLPYDTYHHMSVNEAEDEDKNLQSHKKLSTAVS